MTAAANPKVLLTELFHTAVRAADAEHCLPPYLPQPGKGRTIVLGAGKAAAAMARVAEQQFADISAGLVITRYGHAVACERIEVVEAAHPVPDRQGLNAAARVLELARAAGPDDLVVFVISGGASALLTLPGVGTPGGAADLSLADKQAVNESLLKSGANISEMNTVRKHLSAIKGGRLAAAVAPAQLVTLAISDVPGDDPAVIGSGPTVPDLTTSQDARAILQRYNIAVPDAVERFLTSEAAETPKPDDPAFERSTFKLVAAPRASLELAAERCRELGCVPIVLGDDIEGEARSVAQDHAAQAMALQGELSATDAPRVLISGGETTVTVRGNGRGGRNAEYMLALAVHLNGAEGIHGIACDTDGIDGSEDNAGAYIAPDTLARARASGIDPNAALADNDGYTVFERLGDLVVTGPTLTNVNDFRAVLVCPAQH